jgi:hypothetical protein
MNLTTPSLRSFVIATCEYDGIVRSAAPYG